MRSTALRLLTKTALVCLLMTQAAVFTEAHERYRGGGRAIIVPHYAYAYPYWGWGWGGPFWNYTPYYYENVGRIKIKDQNKTDEVFLNGAYAGIVDKMKTIKLSPGNYTIQVRRNGKDLLNQRVFVVADKTVEVNLDGS
jgi:hypothetical protein